MKNLILPLMVFTAVVFNGCKKEEKAAKASNNEFKVVIEVSPTSSTNYSLKIVGSTGGQYLNIVNKSGNAEYKFDVDQRDTTITFYPNHKAGTSFTYYYRGEAFGGSAGIGNGTTVSPINN